MRPQVVAHRGASDVAAEHTLGAYLAALDAGAEAFECDVRLTADGHLVCVHDRDLRRTASTRGIVSTMNLADLDSLDFASWKNPWADLDDEAPDRDETLDKVLTLRKLLETVADYERPIEIAIETKHPTRYGGLVERRLVEMLRDFGWDRPGTPARVMSFSFTALQRVQRTGARRPGGDADRQGPPLADAASGDRARTGSSGPASASSATIRVSASAWSRAAATSTSGPSTPPATSSSASTSGCRPSSPTDRRTSLERLDG